MLELCGSTFLLNALYYTNLISRRPVGVERGLPCENGPESTLNQAGISPVGKLAHPLDPASLGYAQGD